LVALVPLPPLEVFVHQPPEAAAPLACGGHPKIFTGAAMVPSLRALANGGAVASPALGKIDWSREGY
jgi:hypothetical protein